MAWYAFAVGLGYVLRAYAADVGLISPNAISFRSPRAPGLVAPAFFSPP